MATVWVRFKRTVLVQVIRDHWETFSDAIAVDDAKREVTKALAVQYGVPLLLGAPFWFLHVQLQAVSELLSGMAILTALLFALLILMFDTGITLRKDGAAFKSAHDIKSVITNLRMNVTYAVLVAILLSFLLVAAAVTVAPASQGENGGLGWVWTPIFTVVFTHFGFTLILILKRLRQAFNYIDR